jgi:hypothetical protein
MKILTNSDNINENINYKIALFLIFVEFLFIMQSFMLVYNFKDGLIICLRGDNRAYAELASNLYIYSSENMRGIKEWISNSDKLSAYHWGDIWLITIIIHLFKLPCQIAGDVVVWPLLVNMLIWGLLFFDKKEKTILRIMIIAFLPFFSISIIIPHFVSIINDNFILPYQYFWNRGLVTKDCIPLCLIILTIYMLEQHRIYESIFLMLCIIPFDISWMPSVFTSSGLLVCYSIISKEFTIKEIIIEIMSILISVSYILKIYFMDADGTIANLSNLSSKPSIIMYISNTSIYIMEYLLLFIFYVGLILYLKRKKYIYSTMKINSKQVLMILSLLFGGYIVYSIMYFKTGHYDSSQFFKIYILFNLIVWISLFSVIFYNKNLKKRFELFTSIILITFCLFHFSNLLRGQKVFIKHNDNFISYHKKLINKAIEIEQKNKQIVIGVLFSEEIINNNNMALFFPEFSLATPLGGYLHYMDYIPINESYIKKSNSPVSLLSQNLNLNDDCSLKIFSEKYLDLIEVIGNKNLPDSINSIVTPYIKNSELKISTYIVNKTIDNLQ